MKAVLIIVSALAAMPVFASINLDTAVQQSLAGAGNDDVRQALKDEIQASTFKCKFNVDGPNSDELKGQLTQLLDDAKTVITVSTTQPAITAFTPNNDSDETNVKYTTSTDYKHLVKIDAIRETLTKVHKNVGTLTNPKYEDIVVRTTVIAGSCTVTQ